MQIFGQLLNLSASLWAQSCKRPPIRCTSHEKLWRFRRITTESKTFIGSQLETLKSWWTRRQPWKVIFINSKTSRNCLWKYHLRSSQSVFYASIFRKLVADSQIQFRDMMVLANLLTWKVGICASCLMLSERWAKGTSIRRTLWQPKRMCQSVIWRHHFRANRTSDTADYTLVESVSELQVSSLKCCSHSASTANGCKTYSDYLKILISAQYN